MIQSKAMNSFKLLRRHLRYKINVCKNQGQNDSEDNKVYMVLMVGGLLWPWEDALAIVKISESHLQLSGQAISITATLLPLIAPPLEASWPSLLYPALNSSLLTSQSLYLIQSFGHHLCHNIFVTIIQLRFSLVVQSMTTLCLPWC